MKTSCFKYYTGDDGVAICLYPPIDWADLRFPALAPSKEMFYEIKHGEITKEQYEKRYREEILSQLDPRQIYNMFKNNVLLCFEDPGEFCHRRIVAAWIRENIGIEVPEWEPRDEIKKISNANPLF